MGYRVVYGADPFVREKTGKSRLGLMTAGFALAFVILVRCFWPQGTAVLRQTLLPGEPGALEQITEQIRSGEPVGEAVTAFCRSVVEEALGQGG